VVAVNHGTNGVGPSCGVTHVPAYSDYMAIPLAAKGYAVVATDYMGMGVDEGVLSPYLVGEGEAFSSLDGIRALRNFHDGSRFDAQMLDPGTFILGHSQGGQATLFAHQLWDPSVGGTLLGSLAFAPGWGDIRGANTLIGDPTRSTDEVTLFLLLGLYGNMAYYGMPDPSTWLSSDAAGRLPGLLHDQCFAQLASSVPSAWPTHGALFTSSFLSAAGGCDFSGPCPGFQPWAPWLETEQPGNFHSDVPVLMLQGETDTTVLPYQTACIDQRLRANGTTVATCGYANTDHTYIVNNALQDAMRWMAARRQGQTINVCGASLAESCP
jgi:hypothetical protein